MPRDRRRGGRSMQGLQPRRRQSALGFAFATTACMFVND
jgi:hypothetical protein